MEVDENQNESQNQNEIALLGVTIATYNIELKKIKNDIDLYNKTNDQALENIRKDLTMLKSSQKDEIESCLNNATLSIKTNSNATDRDNFSTTIFEVFPELERDLLSAENIQVTEYIAINQTPHTSTPKECIAETNSEISCDYSEENRSMFRYSTNRSRFTKRCYSKLFWSEEEGKDSEEKKIRMETVC